MTTVADTDHRLLLSLTVPGHPEPWRTYPRRGKQHRAEMARYLRFKAWQTVVYFMARAARIGMMSDGPIILEALFVVSPDTRLVDRDNLAKGLSDALQNTCYRNDSQVIGGEVRRVTGLPERTEIRVYEVVR